MQSRVVVRTYTGIFNDLEFSDSGIIIEDGITIGLICTCYQGIYISAAFVHI